VAKKWSNENLAGALHFVTVSCYHRARGFRDARHISLLKERVFGIFVRSYTHATPNGVKESHDQGPVRGLCVRTMAARRREEAGGKG
jgi:hypothetical protein